MAPIVRAVRGAGRQVIALVPAPYGEWIDAAGVFDDEVARGLDGDHAGTPNLENRIVRAAGSAAAALAVRLPAVRRAYCPWPDRAAFMRAHGVPLWTLETMAPVADCDLWGFTLPHELTYTNVLEMLDLAGVPLHAAERGEGRPICLLYTSDAADE